MGEKFSWDRLLKRGKDGEEDNTISLMPEKVEAPVAPLKSHTPKQGMQKPQSSPPPVVDGTAPDPQVNRAPLVIDWEQFQSSEAATPVSDVPPVLEPPVSNETPAIAPIDLNEVAPAETPTDVKTGNFWNQLNKDTRDAISTPSLSDQQNASPPSASGWDDVELTPVDQVKSPPSANSPVAPVQDPECTQPINEYVRPTEEEIKAKTDAIAQSNAWGEDAPVSRQTPVSEAPPAPPVAPTGAAGQTWNPADETPDVTGGMVSGLTPTEETPASNESPTTPIEISAPSEPPVPQFLAPEPPVTPEQVMPTTFASEVVDGVVQPSDPVDVSPIEPIADDKTANAAATPAPSFDSHEESVNTKVAEMLANFDIDSPVFDKPTEAAAEAPSNAEAPTDTELVSTEFSSPVEAHFDVEVGATESAIDFELQNDQNEPHAEAGIPAVEAEVLEPHASPPVAEVEAPQAVSATTEPTSVQATPADFWANIPGAQSNSTEEPQAPTEVSVSEDTESNSEDTEGAEIELQDLRAGDLLLKHKLIAPAQLERALVRQRRTQEKLGQVLISMGLISERRLLQVLASQKGVSPWHLEDDAPSQDALQLVSHELCGLFQILPVAVRGDMLLLAMRDTADHEAIEAVKSACGKRIEPVLADEVRLATTIDLAYGVAREHSESALQEMVEIAHEHEINLSDGTIVNPERPDHLNALLRELITDAKRKEATSITIGNGESDGEILYRIHGRLCPVQSVPADLARSVLSMATADLNEGRVPFEIAADYKVNITTGRQGENFVVTFPIAEGKLVSLDELGIETENLKLLRELTQRPYGLFLITGSARSAKQATLRALSVEMEMQGRVVARATEGENIAEQINLAVTSESEVIVVGELENELDIQSAVKAASSGHLILAEVTANDATTAIQQLISCGADPYLLATILTGVWSQAVAPKLCLDCREGQPLTELDRVVLDHYGMRHIQKVFESTGCDTCNHTGVVGQIVLSEALPVSSDVSHAISNKAPVEIMADQAGFAGYLPMEFDAMTRIIHGDIDFQTARRLVFFSSRELSTICRKDTWETQAS